MEVTNGAVILYKNAVLLIIGIVIHKKLVKELVDIFVEVIVRTQLVRIAPLQISGIVILNHLVQE